MQNRSKPAKISALVLVKNHRRHIRACLETLKWADEVLVLNDASTDGTTDLARTYANVIICDRAISGSFTRQRNFGIEKATGDWILQVDVDHRITPELAIEIREAVQNAQHNGFRIPVWCEVLGRIFGNDKNEVSPVVLSRRGKALFQVDNETHGRLLVEGTIGTLKGHIIHFGPYDDSKEFFIKNIFYADLEAMTNIGLNKTLPSKSGIGAFWWFFVKPTLIFFKKFLLQRYWKRGMAGFHYALLRAIGYYMVYLRTWELYYKEIDNHELVRYCERRGIPVFLD
jgi:glycosyltransferase involved in cell wall biosynthesis